MPFISVSVRNIMSIFSERNRSFNSISLLISPLLTFQVAHFRAFGWFLFIDFGTGIDLIATPNPIVGLVILGTTVGEALIKV